MEGKKKKGRKETNKNIWGGGYLKVLLFIYLKMVVLSESHYKKIGRRRKGRKKHFHNVMAED